MITSADESSVAVQDMEVTEMSAYQTSGEMESMSSHLPQDLMSGTGTFPSFIGDFDELLISQEFFNGYLWNY
jgi:WRKY transcription factor 29